jgi:hypothetical protein
MSYDLAVWEGPVPASDAEAGRTYQTLYDCYIATDDATAPTERIAKYVRALLARYPDLTQLDEDAVDDSPWADGPMIRNASGPFIYFGVVTSAAAGPAWEFVVKTVHEHGLVAYDPQLEQIVR